MRAILFNHPLAIAALLFACAARAAPPCRSVVAGPLAFGPYNPVSTAPSEATSTISFTCPRSVSPVISLSAGTGRSFSPRAMSGPAGDRLGYNLYTTALRNVVWGDGTGGSVSLPVSAGVGRVTVYGRIFQLQDARVGTYSDAVVVTLNF
jgi:spore coat protein U-like protein